MQKICCIGTSSTGKTALSFQLAAYYTQNGENVKLIQDSSEKYPFPAKYGMTTDSVMWIAHNQILKEIEASALGADFIICDTSPIDILMYAKAADLISGTAIQFLKLVCEQWMESYSRIYLVRDDSLFPESYAREHEFQFDSWLERCNKAVETKVEVVNVRHINDGSFLSKKQVATERICVHGV